MEKLLLNFPSAKIIHCRNAEQWGLDFSRNSVSMQISRAYIIMVMKGTGLSNCLIIPVLLSDTDYRPKDGVISVIHVTI